MTPWWLLYLALGLFALSAVCCLMASRHLRPGWKDNLRGLPKWSRSGRPMWDDFEPTGHRWLLLHWAGLLAFGLCALAFAATAAVSGSLAESEQSDNASQQSLTFTTIWQYSDRVHRAEN